nr:alanyl-tRNA editing protein [Caldimonas mangrovi]
MFREDSYLRECQATLTAVDAAGVQLDRTVFYPQGGGQAGDAGELLLPGGHVLRIADTRKGAEPGQIVHLAVPGQEELLATLQPGQPLTARIAWQRRERHMRFHTATHLLCALVPHPVDGCSITPDYARLDFHMTEPLDKDTLTAGIARLVAEARPVSHSWISDAELDANPQLVRSMSVQPPRGSGRVRVLKIDGVDLQPCGGTHVRNTADVGPIVITKIEKKSAKTRRVVLGIAEPAAG